MNARQLEKRRKEFREFVWDHAADQFQAKFDTRAALTKSESASLRRILQLENLASEDKLIDSIKREIKAHPEVLPVLIQIAGLTRNKIVQDIKAFARARSRRVPVSSPAAIFNSPNGAELGAAYLAKQLLRIYGSGIRVSANVLEIVNQATWPGYIRQERAKRMGHEAEYRLACLLRDCELGFAPVEKAENPLCRDIKIDGVSYDLVAPSEQLALVRVKSTVHTANIGQYGQSKDDLEIRQAAQHIAVEKKANKAEPLLLAFIDGVGFESNRAGLDGVLSNCDEFCQFRTIWKAAALVAHVDGKPIEVALPEDQAPEFAGFMAKYGARLCKMPEKEKARPQRWVSAGDGYVRTA